MRRIPHFFLPLTLVAAAALPALGQEPGASATFVNADGEEIGTASLTDSETGVLIEIEVSGLPAASWLAFHVHEHGMCDPADAHESAGGHFNPDDRAHGLLAGGGPHMGDMPNQYVPEDGVLRAQVFNGMVSLDGEDNGIRGRALMLHADGDDYVSQPAGDAGDRLACAVIE